MGKKGRGQRAEDRISISDFGLRIWDLRCGMWDAGGGMRDAVYRSPFTVYGLNHLTNQLIDHLTLCAMRYAKKSDPK
jgi:hypothetical protein